jgi:manganese oxidase
MLGHKSIFPRFVSYLILVLFFVVLSVSVHAQSTNGSAVATNPAAPREEPAPLPVNQPASLAATSERASTAVDSTAREEKSPTSKSDPPKASPAAPPPVAPCQRTINADVVALPVPIMLNRMGAVIPDGLIFVLKSDLQPGNNWVLKPDKRPRPLVLRANVGDCLNITFTNSIGKNNFKISGTNPAQFDTSEVSLHVQGMEWATGTADDGSFVGVNPSSLANANSQPPNPPTTQHYKLFVKNEGTFLLYTMGDTSSEGLQLARGLFGALNVQPEGAEWYRSEVTQRDLKLATKSISPDGHPVIDYDVKDANGTPILNMLKTIDAVNKIYEIVHTDLTAIITGPNAGRFPGTTGPNKPEPPCNAENNPALVNGIVDPLFCQNPAAPDRKQPYREVTIIYHEVGNVVTEAFPVQSAGSSLQDTLTPGADNFAINYGTGGIAAEVYANRIGVGPMGPCVDCKFEEFFLSAWAVGDPAMLVDRPANANVRPPLPPSPPTPPTSPQAFPCTTADFENPSALLGAPRCANPRVPAPPTVPYTLAALPKATMAYYPDDPSNVYHSYINDHIKFRILHGGTGVTHVHHQHAHQWLQSPNSDEGSYLDSQMISPGSSYTLEMTYNGSGNRNKVVGDSIFHCHFYPHFAAGMWAMWRTHDVFESGTELNANGNGMPAAGARALPDGEIKAGTPIPGLVPLPTIAMAPLPSPVFIDNGQVVYGSPGLGADPTGALVTQNPGFPFFIPGRAGARAPHPPLDFAPDTVNGGLLDGGLPRHLVTGGTISYERHNKWDWSKDLATMTAIQLPELGTRVEQVAMKFFGNRCYATFFPDGTPGSCPSSNSTPPQSTLNTPPTGFILNGLPRKNPAGNSAEKLGAMPGAPFADPAVDDNGNPVGLKRTYKAAAIQLNVTFNQKGWHYPQQRMLTLWQDVAPTMSYTFGNPASGRKPEPLFFRGNSGDVIEYWHTNLVPNYYLVDDFQVRTPTDIIGQHIHLVKFDVTSSDGAGNGFNYEDGTFSPEEVQDIHKALTAPGGSWTPCAGCTSTLRNPQPPPAGICAVPNPPAQCTTDWMGAQTTIQRWYLDPLVDDSGVDRTLRTVFTHDHFGPSTHQQAGLYAGLVVEPRGSIWQDSENGSLMGQPASLPPVRPDGGPTSWKANIVTKEGNDDLSYREFVLEFQDFALAYDGSTSNTPNSDPNVGFRNAAHAINAPLTPLLVSTPINTMAGPKEPPGTQTVNYLQEPIAWRISSPSGDMSYAYDSAFKQAVNAAPNGDPITPLLRAYQNDRVQVRVLVGAHMFAHQFNLEGPRWFSEPGSPLPGAANNSGYRSVQAMGLSEHFEFLFKVPSSSAPSIPRKCPDYMSDGNCTDYLYSPSLDDTGIANGMWGLFRAYDPNKMAKDLQPLTSNPINPNNNVTYATCPANAPGRTFNITAVTAQAALPGGQIVYNSRVPTLRSTIGVMYVRTEDLVAGQLKAPVEPLILRANAGDCITVNLTNQIAPTSLVYQQQFSLASPFNGVDANGQPIFQSKMSKYVGLHPQLLSYDAAISDGINVGWNSQMKNQVVGFNQTIQYQWYAGKIERDGNNNPTHKAVEFGSLNLFPSDPVYQHINGLFGQMIIEPQGSTWLCGEAANLGGCDPPLLGAPPVPYPPTSRASATVTLANGTDKFREFSLMISDDLRISQGNKSAINYRTEPQSFRYPGYQNLTGTATFTNGSKSVTGAGTKFTTELAPNGDNLVLQSSPGTVRGRVKSITNNTQLALAANASPSASGPFAKLISVTDFSCMTSNQLWNAPAMPVAPIGDPQTPIFTADVGDAVRFRMTHPFGTGTSQVFTLHGHVWQRNPYTNNSQVIGDNSLSQWIGSRDNHGATDHFELVINKAGGESKQAGDYLYTVFLPNQANLGAWGIFRVGPKGPAAPAVTACKPPAQPQPVKPKKEDDLQRFIRQPVQDKSKP